MPAKIQRKASPPPAAAEKGPAAGFETPRTRSSYRPFRRVSRRVLVQFTNQLATLSEAGLPIVRCLNILRNQHRPGPFRDVLSAVCDDVSGGSSLSESLAKHPEVFNRLFANMVRAGEAGGILDTVLRRLGEFLERMQNIRDKVRGAMTYPIVVVFVAVGVLSLVFLFVIPKFEEIYNSFDMELPLPTQILIGFSRAAVDLWYLFLGLPVLFCAALIGFYRRLPGFRRLCHRTLLRVPMLGEIVRKTLVARFSRTFGTLVTSGVPHLDALAIVQAATGNLVIESAIENIRGSVREGEGISKPMQESAVFDDIITNMVEVGEETGELDRMLLKVADSYETEVDRSLEIFFKVLEPALLILMAVVVGGIVMALFIPILQIMQALNTQSL